MKTEAVPQCWSHSVLDQWKLERVGGDSERPGMCEPHSFLTFRPRISVRTFTAQSNQKKKKKDGLNLVEGGKKGSRGSGEG